MDCVGFLRIIDGYLDDTLPDEELNDFLRHLDTCEKCREELEIHFIVSEGIALLERDHADYDLNDAFIKNVLKSRQTIAIRKLILRLSYVADTFVFWSAAAALFVYLRLALL